LTRFRNAIERLSGRGDGSSCHGIDSGAHTETARSAAAERSSSDGAELTRRARSADARRGSNSAVTIDRLICSEELGAAARAWSSAS
jgi:hypothetical protein